MNNPYIDPDLENAISELDKEFPGAVFDGSLYNYLERQTTKKEFNKMAKSSILCFTINAVFILATITLNLGFLLPLGLLLIFCDFLFAMNLISLFHESRKTKNAAN